MRHILASRAAFTAVLASNDESARGAMQALKEARQKIPQKVDADQQQTHIVLSMAEAVFAETQRFDNFEEIKRLCQQLFIPVPSTWDA